ncbi:crossover junction endodeoxyribonuclease RuvC [uncultured Varibaculum sp.]|uniref:crossover junction endodeoxyribonuclease RuvC n=1 Tax=uncultured Varibaculum sp. TaxID=413896 RepID=UPI00288B9A55|nr:crossover junction endodeoxyribonuclease RuvC [uncultured Varibaculum sp.]
MEPRIVCGVDPSLTSTGLAKISGYRILDTSLIKTSGKAEVPYRERSRRITHIAGGIATFCDRADLVVIEGPSFRSVSTSTWERAALFYRALEHFLDAGIPFAVTPPKSAKKWASGAGNAGKEAVMDCLVNVFGDFEAPSFDVSDALALAGMGAHHLGDIAPKGRGRVSALRGVQWQ